MQYRKDRYGNELSALGYGCMRFTRKAGGIDLPKAEREILKAVELGVNYYDTAYLYPGSEAALGEIIARNGVRDQINIATKLPHYLLKKPGEAVRAGETAALLYSSSEERALAGMERLASACRWGDEPPEPQPLIYQVLH